VSFGPLDILLIIVGISILVIVHESGHYLAARAFKMRVLRYSIGFGPTLFKYQPKGSPTVFQVAAIPFLAYVQIAGMNPHEDVDPKDPGLFGNKSVFARVVTIAAHRALRLAAALAARADPRRSPRDRDRQRTDGGRRRARRRGAGRGRGPR
jgi:regulator of sigma E protease